MSMGTRHQGAIICIKLERPYCMHPRRMLCLFVLLLLCCLLPLTALASWTDNPPAQPGFTHAPLNVIDTPPGLIPSGAPIVRGPPTIAEIDPNFSGKEIAVGGIDGWLYVYHRD